MGFEHMVVGKQLCCLLAIQLFASGRAEYHDALCLLFHLQPAFSQPKFSKVQTIETSRVSILFCWEVLPHIPFTNPESLGYGVMRFN
jgi:hypothetical protein